MAHKTTSLALKHLSTKLEACGDRSSIFPNLYSVKTSPTFGFVGVCGGDVLGEHPQPLLALVVQPQVHFPPRFVLLRSLALKVPLTVTHPQLIRILRKTLKGEESQGVLGKGNKEHSLVGAHKETKSGFKGP